jgi:stage III sporulation protein SpoIIIAA
VKQEEIFGIIDEAHHRLGHAGRVILENDLKNFRGISRLVFVDDNY